MHYCFFLFYSRYGKAIEISAHREKCSKLCQLDMTTWSHLTQTPCTLSDDFPRITIQVSYCLPNQELVQNQELVFRVTWSHPEYSPDVIPCDCFLFYKLKEHISRLRLTSDSDVRTIAEKWINWQRSDFYQPG